LIEKLIIKNKNMLNVRKISMVAKIGMFALTLMLVALPALALPPVYPPAARADCAP
jgi:hypothetical protein